MFYTAIVVQLLQDGDAVLQAVSVGSIHHLEDSAKILLGQMLQHTSIHQTCLEDLLEGERVCVCQCAGYSYREEEEEEGRGV